MKSQEQLDILYNLKSLGPTDQVYHGLIADALENGQSKEDRTQTGTRAMFGRFARFNLMNKRVPRITTKLVNENPEEEMLWFISGNPSIKALRDKGIGIWNSWLIPGSATYRPMTRLELDRAIVSALQKRDGDHITVKFTHSPVWDAGDFAENADFDDAKTVQVIWTDDESLAKYYKVLTGKEAITLADGTIGAGAYGPQWRRWVDVQIIRKSELAEYLDQGYECITEIQTEHASYDWAGQLVVRREIDQLANAINLLKDNPDSRRIIVSAWNPALTWKAALPPCHLYFQFISHELTAEQRYAIAADRVALAKYDRSKKEQACGMTDWALITWDDWNYARDAEHYSLAELHLKMDDAKIPRRSLNTFLLLRSNDLGLGFPFNVTQYAALTHMVAQVTGLAPGELVWAAVDAHVYENHIQPLKDLQMVRTSKPCVPRLELNKSITNIDDFKSGDLEIIDYDSHPSLAKFMPPAV